MDKEVTIHQPDRLHTNYPKSGIFESKRNLFLPKSGNFFIHINVILGKKAVSPKFAIFKKWYHGVQFMFFFKHFH